MIVIGLAALMSALTVLALIRPLLRAQSDVTEQDPAAAMLAGQVAGMAPDEQAAAATELARRRLRAAALKPVILTGGPAQSRLALAVALLVPALALGLYLSIGNPDLPGQPISATNKAERQAHAQTVAGLARLRRQLQEKPNDWTGWILLAVGDTRLGRPARAIDSWRRAAELRPDHIGLRAALAEALTRQDGIVTPEAASLFASVLAARPGDPRARYYLALAEDQAGRPEKALEQFRALAADSAADSSWRAAVEGHITRLAQMRGEAPAIPPPPAAPEDPSAAPLIDPSAMQAMAKASPAEREKTIATMVDGLAARLQQSPDDPAGWAKLARARGQQKRSADALAAWAEAAKRAATDVDIQIAYADALRSDAKGALSPAFKAQVKRIVALDPDNAYALWWGGIVSGAEGDRDATRRDWNRLLDKLPPESDEFLEVAAALQGL